MVFGRVYSIRSHQSTDIYIGSTTQPLSKRMANHRTGYKRYLNKTQDYISSFEILKYGDAYVELIYEGEFESKEEMRKREGQEIRNTVCVNRFIAGRTQQEYQQDNKEKIAGRHHEYYEDNKDKILEYYKEYRNENRDKILEYQKEYYEENKKKIAEQKFTCECGSIFCINKKSQHLKTKKHQLFLQNQNLNIMPV